MTPKEKAKELVRKYYTWGINKEGQTLSWAESKECALIAVYELIDLENSYNNGSFYPSNYYQEVKKEIENYDTHTRTNESSN